MEFYFAAFNIHSGQVGLAILTSVGLINICETGMHHAADMENELTSVERIIEYTQVPSEPALESDAKNTPSSDWPRFGRIEFKALNFWYDENGSRILRNLTFQIAAKVQESVSFAPGNAAYKDFVNFCRKKSVWSVVQVLAKAQ